MNEGYGTSSVLIEQKMPVNSFVKRLNYSVYTGYL